MTMVEGELENVAPDLKEMGIFVRTEMEKNQNLAISEQYQ
jgi:hypothetical protein